MTGASATWLENARKFQAELTATANALHTLAEATSDSYPYFDIRPATSAVVTLVGAHTMEEHTYHHGDGSTGTYVSCTGCNDDSEYHDFPCAVTKSIAKDFGISLEGLEKS